MSLRYSRGKRNYILAPRSVQSCGHSLLEKKVNIIIFFFSAPSLMYKRRLLITFENSSGPTKCSREKACMCRLVPAFAAREKMFFSAPIYVLNHLLLVSSADNLFKQLRPRSDSAKLSCENGAHVKSRIYLFILYNL